jgi:hypothetical protein
VRSEEVSTLNETTRLISDIGYLHVGILYSRADLPRGSGLAPLTNHT